MAQIKPDPYFTFVCTHCDELIKSASPCETKFLMILDSGTNSIQVHDHHTCLKCARIIDAHNKPIEAMLDKQQAEEKPWSPEGTGAVMPAYKSTAADKRPRKRADADQEKREAIKALAKVVEPTKAALAEDPNFAMMGQIAAALAQLANGQEAMIMLLKNPPILIQGELQAPVPKKPTVKKVKADEPPPEAANARRGKKR